MFEAFSRGYYLGRLYIEPYTGEGAVLHEAQHERVNEQLYADPTAEVPDARPADGAGAVPLVMKLGGTHFPVGAAPDVPEGSLGLPAALLERCRVRNPPALREVLLAKADRAAQLLRWFDGPVGPP